MKTKRKFLSFCAALSLMACVLIMLCARDASADIGPKPSIELTVNFPEEGDYYIVLLCHSDYAGSPDFSDEHKIDKSILTFLQEFNRDGWRVFWSPVGSNVKRAKNSCNCFFSYMVPDPFRVLVVTADYKVYVSDELDQVEFNAKCTYDVATGKLTEQREVKEGKEGKEGKEDSPVMIRSGYVWACLAATLLIEFLAMAFFEIPFTKRNILCFLAINVITNLSYAYYTYHSVADMKLFYGCLIFEMVISIVEAVFYAFMLRDADGKRDVRTSLQYGVTANVVSALTGVVMLLIYRFIVHMNGDFL